MRYLVKSSAVAFTALLSITAIGSSTANSKEDKGKKTETIKPVGDPINCINPRNISSTSVLNNKTIEFRMVGRKFFRSNLKRACPGLRERDAISYTIRGSQLCSVDRFTILETTAGNIFSRAQCGFGKFQQIEKIKPAKKDKK